MGLFPTGDSIELHEREIAEVPQFRWYWPGQLVPAESKSDQVGEVAQFSRNGPCESIPLPKSQGREGGEVPEFWWDGPREPIGEEGKVREVGEVANLRGNASSYPEMGKVDLVRVVGFRSSGGSTPVRTLPTSPLPLAVGPSSDTEPSLQVTPAIRTDRDRPSIPDRPTSRFRWLTHKGRSTLHLGHRDRRSRVATGRWSDALWSLSSSAQKRPRWSSPAALPW